MARFENIRKKSLLPAVSGIKIELSEIEILPVPSALADKETKPDAEVEKEYICHYCYKAFLRNDHLKRHIKSLHTITNYYSCPICDLNCESFKQFGNHLQTIHRDCMSFTCKTCDFECESVSEFVSHFEDHLIANNYLHKCPKCEASFKRADHVKRHLKNVHQRLVQCPTCEEVFVGVKTMKKHYKTDHGLIKTQKKNKQTSQKSSRKIKLKCF